ncbi:NAD(P)-binding protein [Tothia fuscella]|uniref:NAD(P)-binding protein n=1 Tax=Tothia fuscella TaxID=1048955 RepID=A0A9P4U231_9PEZI|nr:NAD(P)-binding protein [Tothia fuscella]
MSPPSEQTVLVTGANGFVAGQIINLLLKKGYKVRGTVRSDRSINAAKESHKGYASQLSFAIVPDMTVIEAYKDAFQGVTAVFHTASPFVLAPKDNESELLKPAVAGVVSALEAAAQYGPNVKAFILMASFASILDLSKGYRPTYTYSEKDWNPISYEEAKVADGPTAYCASKAFAEKAGWEWMQTHKPNFTFSSICPPWVFGPNISPITNLNKLNESTHAIYTLIRGDKIPDADFCGFADVRDVAAAHVSLLEKESAQGERYIVGNHFDYQTAVDELVKEMPELEGRIPKGEPGAGLKEGVYYRIDGSKVVEALGLEYTPLGVTMRDTFKQLMEAEGKTA